MYQGLSQLWVIYLGSTSPWDPGYRTQPEHGEMLTASAHNNVCDSSDVSGPVVSHVLAFSCGVNSLEMRPWVSTALRSTYKTETFSNSIGPESGWFRVRKFHEYHGKHRCDVWMPPPHSHIPNTACPLYQHHQNCTTHVSISIQKSLPLMWSIILGVVLGRFLRSGKAVTDCQNEDACTEAWQKTRHKSEGTSRGIHFHHTWADATLPRL